jgi:hypothetical protein
LPGEELEEEGDDLASDEENKKDSEAQVTTKYERQFSAYDKGIPRKEEYICMYNTYKFRYIYMYIHMIYMYVYIYYIIMYLQGFQQRGPLPPMGKRKEREGEGSNPKAMDIVTSSVEGTELGIVISSVEGIELGYKTTCICIHNNMIIAPGSIILKARIKCSMDSSTCMYIHILHRGDSCTGCRRDGYLSR